MLLLSSFHTKDLNRANSPKRTSLSGGIIMRYGKYLLPLGIAGILGTSVAGVDCYKNCVYSDGERAGVVTKFSHKGWVFKTWEGELQMGSMDTGVNASKWEFSVNARADNESELVKKVQEAVNAHKPVVLKYEQKKSPWSCQSDTQYHVVDVTPVGRP